MQVFQTPKKMTVKPTKYVQDSCDGDVIGWQLWGQEEILDVFFVSEEVENMSNLSTVQVLEILDNHIFDQMLRCDLLKYAIKGMMDSEGKIGPGCDGIIEKYLNDMMYLLELPQAVLTEHIELLKTHGIVKA